MLLEMAEYFEACGVYYKVAGVLERFLVFRCPSALQHQVVTDAGEVLPYYEQKPAPHPDAETEGLILGPITNPLAYLQFWSKM
jgi:hypothetical protein